MSTLIMTARLNDIDPKAWLADVFARIAEIPQTRLRELLPWEWKQRAQNFKSSTTGPDERFFSRLLVALGVRRSRRA